MMKSAADRQDGLLASFIISLAFFGLLRISNLAPRSRGALSLNLHLRLCDVRIARRDSGLHVSLPWTKTWQRRSTPIIIFIPATHRMDCVVRWWRRYAASVSHHPRTAPLLLWPAGSAVTQSGLRGLLAPLHQLIGLSALPCTLIGVVGPSSTIGGELPWMR